ncbi:MAG: hypothetical protein OEY03_04220 [Rhizobacter sp.]|nr:hypothetical protein [Rhizobacter sp.]
MKFIFVTRLSLAVAALAALAVSACASTSPEWESSFGDAARQMRAAQVIDPAAPSRNTGPGSTDGKAAAGAQKAYADSYGYAVKEASQPALSISTGGR